MVFAISEHKPVELYDSRCEALCCSMFIKNDSLLSPKVEALHWKTKFFEKCVYHKTVMFFYVFWGANFENNIENFVVSMVLPLFEVI